ncbi:hypothetical protein N7468_001911 [Penicillium chermesinum]|uniref:penicillopepsin n=1 Tax=Penicillium chermesinum TaxID=63820 RepID=A0A9W9PJM9_9EURO|nr:uncharacterized protein N7468_001911 [Penicillium chermesinum]KAJ5246928.1 hypothetical protein N7468_001911 [Penicillium chermesinum]
MKNSVALLVALALPTLGKLSLRQRDSPAVVGLNIKRNEISDPVTRDRKRWKRDKTVGVALENEEALYFCNVSLGTPAQDLRLVIDTGSSDLWVNAPNSTLLNLLLSSYVNDDFNITYADDSGATGNYLTDTLRIGGSSLKNFQFGVGYTSSSAEGVLGIGYPLNEAQVGVAGQTTYANLPKAMVNNGLIRSSAYSLWLNDLDSNEGSILFGGVDTAKYHGSLETLPIQKTYGEYTAFYIALTSLSLTNSSGTTEFSSKSLPSAALLDSGSSLTYLPDSIVTDIYDALGVTWEASQQTAYLPCSIAKKDYNISYTFSSPTINVAISELILGFTGATYSDGEEACVFGLNPSGGSTSLLGDTFLRSAYVVYDISNNEISLANTNFNTQDSHVVEIGTGDDAVPGATAVANPVTTIAVGTEGARIGGAGGSSSTGVISGGTQNAAARPTGMASHFALGLGAALLAF